MTGAGDGSSDETVQAQVTALGRVGETIRRTDDALSTGDRLLKYITTLAKEGRLTPERLLDDIDAILGLSEWAAESEQWERLLELVKTLQAAFGIARRVEEWLTLLNRGRSAAVALGDKHSEVWVLRQLATASASAGDATAAQRYRNEADNLQRTEPIREGDSGRRQTTVNGGGGVARVVLRVLALIIAAGAGGGAGYALGNSHSGVGVTTTRVPVTITVGGQTVTTAQTVTLPATTVTSTTTQVTTTTITATTTVTATTTAAIP
jgi:hypothetical protein